MRRGRTLMLGLLAAWFVGCATGGEAVRPNSLLSRFHPLQGPTGPDVIQMEVAVLERPVGDRYLNEELWAQADEMVVDLDQKVSLENNGLRVCQVAGITPPGLQALLTSKRSCVNHRYVLRHAGSAYTLLLGPKAQDARFQIHWEGQAEEADFEQAQYKLEVLPTLGKDAHVHLRFTPSIEHGEAKLVTRRNPDGAFALNTERPVAAYPALSWEVSLAQNEYVAVGAHFDRPQTLGHQFFIRPDEPVPVQRLLVVRTSRLRPGVERQQPADGEEEDLSLSESPPLALQAGWTAARGSAR